MKWEIEHIYDPKRDGLVAYHSSYDIHGNHYVDDYEGNWIGCLDPVGKLKWSAGPANVPDFVTANSDMHIDVPLNHPAHVEGLSDKSVIVTCFGDNKVYKIMPEKRTTFVLIDALKIGLRDIGYCELDSDGNIWANEITGCKIWQFSPNGEPKQVLGNGEPDFQKEAVSFDEVQFNWVYDIRTGPDGNIYVLDSKNFSVRMIDIKNRLVRRIAGTGEAGYTGDCGDALLATFGSSSASGTEEGDAKVFDGPWAMSVDEERNIFVGDTHNHVVRMIESDLNIITTIAGKHKCERGRRNDPGERDPFKLNLPVICSMDYHKSRLFVPEFDGDLVVLKKIVQ
jgi:hypothetical protein